MKKIAGFFLLFGFGLVAADFWQKPYTQWSDKDAAKMMTNSPWAKSAARLSAIRPNTGSGLLCLGMVTAAGTLGSIAAAAARVPALTTLATAATARKRRRVGSHGGNIMG